MDAKEIIARIVAQELHGRTLVNIGIGLPTLVAYYVPAGISVALQSENGIIGFGATPHKGREDPNLTDGRRRLHQRTLPGDVSFDRGRGGRLTASHPLGLPRRTTAV
jgi:acetate CoA/acetoacetate CoA-transferase beta subunit